MLICSVTLPLKCGVKVFPPTLAWLSVYRYDYDPEQFAGNQTPVLVVGTKADQAERLRENVLSRASSVAEECGADEINLVKYLMSRKDGVIILPLR